MFLLFYTLDVKYNALFLNRSDPVASRVVGIERAGASDSAEFKQEFTRYRDLLSIQSSIESLCRLGAHVEQIFSKSISVYSNCSAPEIPANAWSAYVNFSDYFDQAESEFPGFGVEFGVVLGLALCENLLLFNDKAYVHQRIKDVLIGRILPE